jgi:NAD/NADP transhydrogenase beta subunit
MSGETGPAKGFVLQVALMVIAAAGLIGAGAMLCMTMCRM